jgi:hypothetical protein
MDVRLALIALTMVPAQPLPAPQAGADYWRLAPFLEAQITDSACPVARVAAALGALGNTRAGQPALLAADTAWRGETGPGGEGVSFDALLRHLRQGLRSAGMADARLTVFHPADTGPQTLASMRALLAAAAGNAGDVVLLSFDQGWLWGEPSVGHVSPVGDYDAATGKVLIMDVDGAHFGPHWVAEADLLAAMTRAGDDDPDGIVVIRRTDVR